MKRSQKFDYHLGFEVWAVDDDQAYVIRLSGDAVTGYYGIIPVLSVPRWPAELERFDFHNDPDRLAFFQELHDRANDPTWKRVQNFEPSYVVTGLVEAERAGSARNTRALVVLAIVVFGGAVVLGWRPW